MVAWTDFMMIEVYLTFLAQDSMCSRVRLDLGFCIYAEGIENVAKSFRGILIIAVRACRSRGKLRISLLIRSPLGTGHATQQYVGHELLEISKMATFGFA